MIKTDAVLKSKVVISNEQPVQSEFLDEREPAIYYLHEKHTVVLGYSNELLHLSRIHGQRFLYQNALLVRHEELPSTQVVDLEGADVNNVFREKRKRLTLREALSKHRFTLSATFKTIRLWS